MNDNAFLGEVAMRMGCMNRTIHFESRDEAAAFGQRQLEIQSLFNFSVSSCHHHRDHRQNHHRN